ncbi:MAG: T9SS C-terminal target domain-containing protein, partial [Bacteroidetes bacterium]|nr:T9SS C-terminal target domain-containing protein [Bacteroidota bacterium]
MQRELPTLFALLIMVGFGTSTALAQTDNVEARPTVTVTDASINAGETVTWTNSNVYILSGLVIVEDGAELHIEAGTVVKAEDGQSTNASALVVARGGKIYAMGEPNAPIIFTSVQDNISSADLLTYEDRGLWGGI